MRRIGGITWLVWIGLVVGCRPADIHRPPTVRYGEEACAHCRMIISDERFAAARVGADGETLKYDDIGCLLSHGANDVRPASVYWVHNFRGLDWLDARAAHFVHAANIASPMGYGLAAVPTAQAARALATEPAGATLRFEQLAGFLAETGRERHDPTSEENRR
jgi:copper chaperone NosL